MRDCLVRVGDLCHRPQAGLCRQSFLTLLLGVDSRTFHRATPLGSASSCWLIPVLLIFLSQLDYVRLSVFHTLQHIPPTPSMTKKFSWRNIFKTLGAGTGSRTRATGQAPASGDERTGNALPLETDTET
jgi:hypothetical protein